MALPVLVRFGSSSAFAIPKSETCTVPSSSRRMFPGFTSRWITPRWWEYASAPATCAMTRCTSGIGIGPSSARIAESERPITARRTRTMIPCPSRSPWIATTFRWPSAAASFASRRNRSRIEPVESTSGWSTLSATIRASARSNARYTVAIPPRPSTPTTSNSHPTTCCTRPTSSSGRSSTGAGAVLCSSVVGIRYRTWVIRQPVGANARFAFFR